MADYTVELTRSARRELEQLDGPIVRRLFRRITALAVEPCPSGCRKLQGNDALWRIRVGDYRVIYAIDDQERVIDIFAVRHRREAYR